MFAGLVHEAETEAKWRAWLLDGLKTAEVGRRHVIVIVRCTRMCVLWCCRRSNSAETETVACGMLSLMCTWHGCDVCLVFLKGARLKALLATKRQALVAQLEYLDELAAELAE